MNTSEDVNFTYKVLTVSWLIHSYSLSELV